MALAIQDEISNLRREPTYGRFFAAALEKIQNAINSLGTNLAADPTGTLPALSPLQGVNVASDGAGLVHVTLTDNAETQKSIRYFTEWSPDGASWYPEDMGASRQRVLSLPQGSYTIRAFHQAQGGLPSTPVYYGGPTSPTKIVISSGSTTTLLAPTGSGTGAPDGSQPGVGLGKTLFRQKTGPKRAA
jgi:hypothetical protein